MDNIEITPVKEDDSREEVVTARLKELENQINDIRETKKDLKKQYVNCLIIGLLIRLRLSYLLMGQYFREKVTSFIGWRWAVVLIGSVAVGGIFFLVFPSWGTGLCGLITGATLFTCFVSVPSDLRLLASIEALNVLLTENKKHCQEKRKTIGELSRKYVVVQNNYAQTTNQLEQYRQSCLYKLRTLAEQNWKAMRGTDLEIFLEKVFTELHFSVDRKGGPGDQGVDLIVGKNGRRMALQVKGYLDSVPNTAIQEAFTGMAFYRCDACAVITNSRFTSGGRRIAESVGCVLVDENALPRLILGQLDLWQEALLVRTKASSGTESQK